MELKLKSLRKSINKAHLKEVVDRPSFNRFKTALAQLIENVEAAERNKQHEEHFKNFLTPFFNTSGFGEYYINTSGRIDLAVHNGSEGSTPVGVLIEAKRPSNRNEMIAPGQLNRKGMHEAVLYYLDQRMEERNIDLKHVIITSMWKWFIFDAQEFERCFYKPSTLRKIYKEWKANQKVSSNNEFMYEEVARFIASQDTGLNGIQINLRDEAGYLNAKEDTEHEKKLIPLYKFISPVQLLKEPFANDSNTLNREFYRELLYILGLEETKDGSARYIERVGIEDRQPGSLIENAIRILDSENRLSRVEEPEVHYGKEQSDQLFNVALELGITWINRILFLKLLEAQLFRYHRQAKAFRFLHIDVIDDYDELNKLFFQVLAKKEEDRPEDIAGKYGHIPYLNSSLFDLSALEYQTMVISGLDDHTELPVYGRSVLTDKKGQTLKTLEYLFRFLDAYDFSAEKGEEIRRERKTLINASVLGLIFEKINGYKDGSFYTPGFITGYMARETLRKAVIDKFATCFGNDSHKSPLDGGTSGNAQAETDSGMAHEADDRPQSTLTFTGIYNAIGRDISIEAANEIINSITICDPAVGSGHFLVSCLNELLAIKSELGILCDADGKRLREVNVAVENDELIVTFGDEELFEYDVSTAWSGKRLTKRKVAPERQRVQQTLFREKRQIIENGLFGVDINPNSVKICRLRLWIELLKRTYYTEESGFMKLEVLPNIDMNIQQGNSLISRFDLDSDLSTVFKDSGRSLADYKEAVRSYKHTGDRAEKQRLQKLIKEIKKEYSTTLYNNRKINKDLSKARGRLEGMQNADLFGDKKFTKKEVKKQEKKVLKLEEQKAEEERGAFYHQAFEWRFEFPEVLDAEGRFSGFDVVIGNPPYIRQEALGELKDYFKTHFNVYQGTADLYSYFIEQGMKLLRQGGVFNYIVSNKWMRANYGKPLREWIQQYQIESIIDFGDLPVFEEATTYPCLLQLKSKKASNTFTALKIDNLDFDDLSYLVSENGFKVYQSKLLIDGWTLISKKAQELLQKIKEKGKPLGEYVNGNIYRGILTGLNEAFIIDEETKNNLIEKDPKSKKLIKPFLKGRNINRYEYPKAKQYLILIPNGWTNSSTNSEDKWGWFSSEYSAVANYLTKFEKKAKKRYDQGEFWWELRACSYYNEFEQPKIILPDISLKGNFTLDDSGDYYMVNTAYMICNNEKFLLGILASDLIDFFYRNISSTYRGGYLRFIFQYLEQIPIIEATDKKKKEIESLVYQILTAKRENPNAETSKPEAEIDRLVYKLYGLKEEEIAIVKKTVS